MRKRIYRSMLLLSLITILFISFLITGAIYRESYIRMQQEIRNEAFFISTGYKQSGRAIFSDLENKENTSRITWIAADGTVLYDNIAEAESMENHRNRPEIAEAFERGSGESVHLSKTLGTQTFYRAMLLNDGSVLRVSATTNSVFKTVLNFIPYITFISLPVIMLTMIIANILTKRIIVPLNSLNLEKPLLNDVYDELSPLLSRMARQNEQIELQFKKLKEKQEEFNAITENISEGIVVLNSNGHILSINKSAAAIFGVGKKDNINKNILTLNRNITFQKAVESAIDGQSYEDTFTRGSKTFNLLASPVKVENPVKGVILFILDITEKQAAEKIRREFSANVSHELKTPLTTISGYAELIKNGMVKPKDIDLFSERIYSEAQHLIRLVEDIIQISRLDEKNINLSFEKIDLLELVREAADRLVQFAKQKQIKILINGEKTLITGVRQIIVEMIYNLLDNAIKYNKEKGQVDVSIRTSNENVILTVSDNGYGIAKEHQNRVFERFYRIDKSHSRSTGGTGLGLSIVKHSAEFHNAGIHLQSEPGKGTTVKVIFRKD